MKKTLLPLAIAFSICFSASAQTPATGQNSILTDKMLEAAVKFDQKRFNLTPEQTVQDRKVLADYPNSTAISSQPIIKCTLMRSYINPVI